MTIPELCVMASEKPPAEWSREILRPMRGACIGIFGYRQVAMEKTYTLSIVDALLFTLLCKSKNEAYRALQSNAVAINRIKVNDPKRMLTATDALPNLGAIVLENGRFNFGIIEICG